MDRLRSTAVARALCLRLAPVENIGLKHRDECASCQKIAEALRGYATAELAVVAVELVRRMSTRSRYFAADLIKAWRPE